MIKRCSREFASLDAFTQLVGDSVPLNLPLRGQSPF